MVEEEEGAEVGGEGFGAGVGGGGCYGGRREKGVAKVVGGERARVGGSAVVFHPFVCCEYGGVGGEGGV